MMTSPLYCPSRPKNIHDLMKRVTDPACDEKEKTALDALVACMIDRFRDKKLPSYYSQVPPLSSVANDNQYDDITKVFSDTIISHSANGNALDPDLLPSFLRVLRTRPHDRSEDGLFPAINGLRERLEKANQQNNMKVQYFLMYTLGTLLDVAIDTKVSKIDQDSLRGPLLTLVGNSKDSEEPRLAQAACYAYEALKGVSSNQGPWDLFWKTSGQVVAVAAKMAGAVSVMDPNKLVEAVPDIFELLGLFKEIYSSIEVVTDGMKKMEDIFVENVQRRQGQNSWYAVLRYTGMLVDAGGNGFDTLKQILPKVPCGDKPEFWCGMYAQIEQGYLQGNQEAKDRIIAFTEWTFTLTTMQSIRSKEPRVQEWTNLIAKTFGMESKWQKPQPKAPRRFPLCFLKKEKPEPKLTTPFNPKTKDHDSKSLLDEAWRECKTAQLFYVDTALMQYYTCGNMLKIWRISNDTLDIDNCYINLGVVETSPERPERRDQGEEAFELSLRKRLRIEAPREGKEIQLPELYNERELQTANRQRIGKPKRILVRGRAGVGKTTLCKKIVHDFIHGKMPLWDFERLIWVPLRKLKGRPSAEDFLGQEVWPNHQDKTIFIPVLLNAIFNQRSEKTLLLLDGFDEIVAERTPSGDLVTCQQILNLLNHSNVIITSRPHTTFDKVIDPFDLELETVGFRSDQVNTYVERVMGLHDQDWKSVEEIKSFVNGHWLMKGLLQIPIQLDALCYTWKEPYRSGNIKTMTALYQAIELKLWKKDILLRGKMSEFEANKIRIRSHVESVMPDHMDLVQKVAFCGLYNNIVDFSSDHRMAIYENLPGMENKTDNLLDGLSFLRTVDSSAEGRSEAYYFIHLTFQEYFAAHYFVQCWISNTPLTCVHIYTDSAECDDLDATEFIQREKYNGRYDIMWRFVAGLLYHQNKKKLTEFMQVLQTEPRDLLGPTHLRILMHCFSEVPSSSMNCELKQIAQSMEEGLSELLRIVRWDDDDRKSVALFHEMEFPSYLFESILDGGTQWQRRLALHALAQRAHLSSDLIPKVKDLIGLVPIDKNDGLTSSDGATDVLVSHCETVPQIIIQLLTDPRSEVQRYTCAELFDCKFIPEEVIEVLISGLQGPLQDKHTRANAAIAIQKQSNLSERSIAMLESLLQVQDPRVRTLSVTALINHLSKRPRILDKVLRFQNDHDRDLREVVATALCIPDQPKVCNALMVLLNDRDEIIRSRAAQGLEMQKALTPEILDSLVFWLKGSSHLKSPLMRAYAKHCPSTKAIFDALIPILNEYGSGNGEVAAEILSNQPVIPEHYIHSFASHMQGEVSSEQRSAIRFFSAQSDLSDEMLQLLIPHLQHRDGEIREDVAQGLGRQSKFPEYAAQHLAPLLTNDGSWTARCAMTSLCRSKTLSEDILKAVVSYLQRQNSEDAAECLKQQMDLPPAIRDSLVQLLNHEHTTVRSLAESVLRQRDAFYAILPDLNYEVWEFLCHVWFDNSLDEDWSCVLLEDTLHITTPQGLHTVELKTPDHKKKFHQAIEAVRNTILRAQSQVDKVEDDSLDKASESGESEAE